jgi:Ca2+/H+ antiporter, TMEM165/GDT1 family
VPDLLIAAMVFGTVFLAELPDNSGLASLVLSTRYRPGGVIAGAFAAFAVHVVLAVTCGSLLALLPYKIVQIFVAVVFLAGAVLLLRTDDDDDDIRLKAHAAGFWAVAATSFGVILLAELGDLSDIVIANLAAKYHEPVPVGIGSVMALWAVVVVAIAGGRGLQRILPMRRITRLAALVMVFMAGFTLVEAMRLGLTPETRSRPGYSQPAAIAPEMPISTTAPTTSPCSPAAVLSFPPNFSPTSDITKLMSPNRVTAKTIGYRTVPSASPTARSSRLSAAPLTSSRHPCQTCGVSSPPRSASMSPHTAVTNSIPAPAQRAADPNGPARPVPMSIPVAGITTSHKPKTVATLISVRRSTPLTPMAIAAPKLFSPSARATISSATMVRLCSTRAGLGQPTQPCSSNRHTPRDAAWLVWSGPAASATNSGPLTIRRIAGCRSGPLPYRTVVSVVRPMVRSLSYRCATLRSWQCGKSARSRCPLTSMRR